MALTYNPSIFNVANLSQAMQIILTPEGSTTEQRWQVETPYLAELITQSIEVTSETVVLDYGCGIGRMAKELIERSQCRVVGVDISPSMRALAVGYVNSERFFACPPSMLTMMIERGMKFDAAISIWVLQHCLRPEEDIDLLRQALKSAGNIFIVNNIYRAVPTKEQVWANDGANIKELLSQNFKLEREGSLDPNFIAASLSQLTFWASLRNR